MTLRSAVFAAAISIATITVGSESDVATIQKYVISKKHWSPKIFRIERKECDCAFALYNIIYLPELKNTVPVGGKSFAVHYDEQRHRVIQETHFQ